MRRTLVLTEIQCYQTIALNPGPYNIAKVSLFFHSLTKYMIRPTVSIQFVHQEPVAQSVTVNSLSNKAKQNTWGVPSHQG